MVKTIWIALAIALGLIAFSLAEECVEWSEFHAEAYEEYADEFTRLFESLEFKQAKNGAPMIRRAGEKSFKFVPKGK